MTAQDLRYLYVSGHYGGCQVQSTKEILENNSIAIDSKAIEEASSKSYREESKADKNKRIEDRAKLLMGTLKAEPRWLRFFCKCFYQLPEGTIGYILEGAKQANNPCNYFCASAKRELKKLNK